MQLCEPWLVLVASGGAVLPNNGVRALTRNTREWNRDQYRLIGRHLPIIQHRPRDEGDSGQRLFTRTRNLRRGHCMVCGAHSNLQCKECKIYLCATVTEAMEDAEVRSCWERFHTLPNFLEDDDDQL